MERLMGPEYHAAENMSAWYRRVPDVLEGGLGWREAEWGLGLERGGSPCTPPHPPESSLTSCMRAQDRAPTEPCDSAVQSWGPCSRGWPPKEELSDNEPPPQFRHSSYGAQPCTLHSYLALRKPGTQEKLSGPQFLLGS